MQTNEFKQEVLPLSKSMLRFAALFLKDSDASQDIVQEVFLKLWQIKDELDHVDNLKAFVTRMVRNKCLDHIRAGKKWVIRDTLEQKANELADEYDRVEWSETSSRIRVLISKLPEQQQTVMYLRDIEQNEYDEIEDITGLNANAIRVNLSRARKKVRDELLKTWNHESEHSKDITAKIL